MIEGRTFGRFAEPARLVLAALRGGPRGIASLFDEVRRLNGPIGPGTLFAAIARLEHDGVVERVPGREGLFAYRLRGTPEGPR